MTKKELEKKVGKYKQGADWIVWHAHGSFVIEELPRDYYAACARVRKLRKEMEATS